MRSPEIQNDSESQTFIRHEIDSNPYRIVLSLPDKDIYHVLPFSDFKHSQFVTIMIVSSVFCEDCFLAGFSIDFGDPFPLVFDVMIEGKVVNFTTYAKKAGYTNQNDVFPKYRVAQITKDTIALEKLT